MDIFIIEDDEAVISVLEDIIGDHHLGRFAGSCSGETLDVPAVCARNPDIVIVDFLMPGMDGTQAITALKEAGCEAKFVMLSQVSAKEMVAKAYTAGADFYISKPINLIEVKTVLTNIAGQIRNERTISNLRSMFLDEIHPEENRQTVQPADRYGNRLRQVLSRVGMSGEKGADDIVLICSRLHAENARVQALSVTQLCEYAQGNPKNTEQRIRRAIAAGMNNLAHLGVEDYLNETFTEYAGTLFPFEEIRNEMNRIRGKSPYSGKVSIKKFLDALMLEAEKD